jgi:hypothetical protein
MHLSAVNSKCLKYHLFIESLITRSATVWDAEYQFRFYKWTLIPLKIATNCTAYVCIYKSDLFLLIPNAINFSPFSANALLFHLLIQELVFTYTRHSQWFTVQTKLKVPLCQQSLSLLSFNFAKTKIILYHKRISSLFQGKQWPERSKDHNHTQTNKCFT